MRISGTITLAAILALGVNSISIDSECPCNAAQIASESLTGIKCPNDKAQIRSATYCPDNKAQVSAECAPCPCNSHVGDWMATSCELVQ